MLSLSLGLADRFRSPFRGAIMATMTRNSKISQSVVCSGGLLMCAGLFFEPTKTLFSVGYSLLSFGMIQSYYGSVLAVVLATLLLQLVISFIASKHFSRVNLRLRIPSPSRRSDVVCRYRGTQSHLRTNLSIRTTAWSGVGARTALEKVRRVRKKSSRTLIRIVQSIED